MSKSARTKKATPAGKGGAIEDIQHEDVPKVIPSAAPIFEQIIHEAEEFTEEQALQLTIQKEIKRFNLADAGIAALTEKYSALTISGVEDKEGYKIVREAWTEVRTTRTALEKKGLEIRADYTKITKAISKEEDRLVDLIKPLEQSLHAKWKAIDDEKEKIKKQQQEAEENRLQGRLRELLGAGMTLTDGYYQLGETIGVDIATLRTMTDEQYEKLRGAVIKKAEEIAEQKRIADAKAEEERQEMKAKREKLEQEQAEFEKRKRELEDAQAALKKQQEDAAIARKEMRLDMLQSIGMTISADGRHVEYHNGVTGYSLTMEEVLGEPDASFPAIVIVASKKVADCKLRLEEHLKEQEREKKALEEKVAFIHEKMTGAGMEYNMKHNSYGFVNDFLKLATGPGKLLTATEEDIIFMAEEFKAKIDEAVQLQEGKNKLIEADRERERQKALGDEVNFNEYLSKVEDLEWPDLESIEYQDKLHQFRTLLKNIINEYRPEVEAVKP